MTYGLVFEDVKEIIKPVAVEKNWGHYSILTNRPEYGLEKIFLKKSRMRAVHEHA